MATVDITLPDRAASRAKEGAIRPLLALILISGLVIFVVPTMIFVVRETWSGEQGAHSPIVLFTGLWLLWREWAEARPVAKAPNSLRVWSMLALMLPLYVFARVTSIVELEGYFMYGTVLVVLYSAIGGPAMKRLWFPLFYLTFIFPPPETIVAAVTTPLKMSLSQAAVALLNLLGYPIGGEGVRIYIGQYELLVAAACSGLNSIISLAAISLFYIYIRHQADWRYSSALALLIVPVALLANFLRVIILILMTYYAGDAAAQGFLHDFAGLFMFAIALLTMFALDSALRPLWAKGVHRVRS